MVKRSYAATRTMVSLLIAAATVSLGSAAASPRSPNGEVVSVAAATESATRRVNVPELTGQPFAPAIFWLGSVGPTANYADVRVWYYQPYVKFEVHIVDRDLWYNGSATGEALTGGDAVSLYLQTETVGRQSPASTSYRFVAQLTTGAESFRGNGTGWVATPLPFTPTTSWRGDGPNDTTWDMGWTATFEIPFSSLGLTAPPPAGTVWRLGVAVHDRDDSAGTPIPDQIWPETMQKLVPSTWGELSFGRPVYTPAVQTVAGTTVIRHGLNGAVVPDAAVGGHTVCGEPMNAWTEWGNANYAGYTQFNIQNQWDIADFMCFSKYYVTFPLSALPAGKSIVSARIRLNLFGNAGYTPDDAKPSAIDVFTVENDWQESTITWNNAPYAGQNVSVTWVNPVKITPAGPYEWDVSYAVAQAYATGRPLRLAFYSTDGDYHSGKYFWTSDVEDWNAAGRPTLEVNWGAAAPPRAPTGVRIIQMP